MRYQNQVVSTVAKSMGAITTKSGLRELGSCFLRCSKFIVPLILISVYAIPAISYGASGAITQTISTDQNNRITYIDIKAVLHSDSTTYYTPATYGGCACNTYAFGRYYMDNGGTQSGNGVEFGRMNNAFGQYDHLGETKTIYSGSRFKSNVYWNHYPGEGYHVATFRIMDAYTNAEGNPQVGGVITEINIPFYVDSVGNQYLKLNEKINLGTPGEDANICFLQENNPINVGTGNKYESVIDFTVKSIGENLVFKRYYNSRSDVNGTLGFGWSHTYNTVLTVVDSNHVSLLRGDGGTSEYARNLEGVYHDHTNTGYYLKQISDGTNLTGWELYHPDGTRYEYDTGGKLVAIHARGLTTNLAYDATDKLTTITDAGSGRRLTLTYDTNGKIDYVSGPATAANPGGIYADYGYDANDNLTDVVYADGSGFRYSYNDPNDIHNLTDKEDRSGHMISTWTYNADDRAITGYNRDRGSVSINYTSPITPVVTDEYGREINKTTILKSGKVLLSSVTGGTGCTGCSTSDPIRYDYDEKHRITEKEYADGRIDKYEDYDSRGNPQRITEAFGSPEQRTTLYTYHPILNTPLSIRRPSVLGSADSEVIFDYDNDGNDIPNEDPTLLLYRTIQRGYTKDAGGTAVSSEAVTEFAYNTNAQVLSVDGPLSGNQDTTTYTYDASNGDLLTITVPNVGTTTYSQYDAAGNPGSVMDPNGIAYIYTYDGRGRVLTVTNTSTNDTTTMVYNTEGEISSVMLPNGISTSFTYGSTYGRLVEMADVLGNKVVYGYDDNGNRIEESNYDSLNNRKRWLRFDYNGPSSPGNLFKAINPDDTYSEYTYNSTAKVSQVKDPNNKMTQFGYDILGRLINVTQPGTTVTTYGYDAHDNLVSVTDAENLVTTYQYDDFGRVVSETSPNTGAITYVYDTAGNLTSKTDANGTAITYTYDLLNRLTGVSFTDASQNITYSYDEGVNGLGRLTGMIDPSGTYVYGYDVDGNLVSEGKTVAGVTFTTGYDYDEAGLLTGMTYPDGRTITYVRDDSGNLTAVTTTKDSIISVVAQDIAYLPFGPLSDMTLGNGLAQARGYDQLYRAASRQVPGFQDLVYGLDAVGNITDITDQITAAASQTFGYDDLYRLTSATGLYGTIGYTYDKVGNRLTRTQDGQTDTYAYESGTHKLTEITGPGQQTFGYDAVGNMTTRNSQTLIYNLNNRLIEITDQGTTVGEYVYNGKGQRIKKTVGADTTVYHYDLTGNLIGESDAAGNFTAQFIYLGAERLAAVAAGTSSTDFTVTVSTSEGRNLAGIKVYAFTEADAYTGKSATTDESGQAVFSLADFTDGNYKFRADYLSDQFWTPLIAVPDATSTAVVIDEQTTTVTVTQGGQPQEGVKVYLFNEAGAYLGLYGITATDGTVQFVLVEGQGYTFRADVLGGQFFSETVAVSSGPNDFAVNTGGGTLTLTLDKAAGQPMAGIKTYLFSEAGAYLGLTETTDAAGQAGYAVPSGNYKIRADYFGYQYWSDVVFVTADDVTALTIDHQDVTVTVTGDDNGGVVARSNVPVYLFTAAGAYQNMTTQTDANGQATFNVPAGEYKIRADYLNQQFWSGVFDQADSTIVIQEGTVEVTVLLSGSPLTDVPIYVFNAAGTYLNLTETTDGAGAVSFRLPQGDYNFRADFMSSEYFSGDITVIADQLNQVSVSTGGSSFTLAVERSAGVPLESVTCYLFTDGGSYLGNQVATSSAGEAQYDLPDGDYKVRIDYLGYQYWTPTFTIPGTTDLTHLIDHQDTVITVDADNGLSTRPLAGVSTYLFTSGGAYQNITLATDANGQVTYDLPPGDYKVRADYLNAQYWTPVFDQTDQTVTIDEGTAQVQVLMGANPLEGTTVYVYNASDVYLNINGVTSAAGIVYFDLPAGTYKFRADFQSSQFWITEQVTAYQVTEIALSTGGGAFELTVEKGAGLPLANAPVYVFSEAGSYLGMTDSTDAQGKVSFDLSEGSYKFRVDYRGYQFWSNVSAVPTELSDVLTILHSDVTISANEVYGIDSAPLPGVKVYVFTSAGAYQNLNATTDANGQVVLNLPDREYKVRVDYLSRQYWSDVFVANDVTVNIGHGYADITVTDLGLAVDGVNVYLFKDTGAYLGEYEITDANGQTSFLIPAGAYKFRVDYNGTQYWSDVVNILASEETVVDLALDLLAMDSTRNPHPVRFDGTPPKHEPVMLASLMNITGILNQTVVAATGPDALYWFINGHLGTPQKLIDSDQAVVWEGSQEPFGNTTVSANTLNNNFRFPGQYFDSESGLHYNYHRYYDPSIGRYLRSDPIGLDGGINLFAYALNNPINETDPDGLRSFRGIPRNLNPFGVPSRVQEQFKKETIAALAATVEVGKCTATCTLKSVVGDVSRDAAFGVLERKAQQSLTLVKNVAKKTLAFYSAYGLIECIVRCGTCD